MASRSKIVAAAAGFALFSAGFGSVARAEDATSKPDAMSSDHMSSDHMSGMMKKPGMKHDPKQHMKHEGAMSKDHMAPSESKQ